MPILLSLTKDVSVGTLISVLYIKMTEKLIVLNNVADGAEIQDLLEEMTGQRTVPNIFIDGQHIGGNSEIQKLHQQGRLEELL